MGVAARLAPKGLGPQNSTKKLPHWMNLLGQPLSRNHVCGNLGHEPRPAGRGSVRCRGVAGGVAGGSMGT